MKRVLVICPTQYEIPEIARIQAKGEVQFVVKPYSNHILTCLFMDEVDDSMAHINVDAVIDEMVQYARQEQIDGVISISDYPGAVLASIVADILGLPGPSPHAVFLCQDKYQSRMAQRAGVPSVTPHFMKFDPQVDSLEVIREMVPCFIKPVKGKISMGASAIDSYDQLLARKSWSIALPYAAFFNTLMGRYTTLEPSGHCFLLEQKLDGHQVTLEGFVYDGAVTVLGVIDSIMYPGTRSFERFEYPSRLPDTALALMHDIAQQFMPHIGYNNGFFNIEFMYNPATHAIHIIEVNSRMCSESLDLYGKVDGYNPYDILVDIALGKKPNYTPQKGRHTHAGIYVLRTFSDATMIKNPDNKCRETFKQMFPDGCFYELCPVGDRLSDYPQDTESFRYALINLGAPSYEQLQENFARAKSILTFDFA